MMIKKEPVNFLTPSRLLQEFDEIWKEANFASRTAALNQAIREFNEKRRKVNEQKRQRQEGQGTS